LGVFDSAFAGALDSVFDSLEVVLVVSLPVAVFSAVALALSVLLLGLPLSVFPARA
jgi:hypothetical protein